MPMGRMTSGRAQPLLWIWLVSAGLCCQPAGALFGSHAHPEAGAGPAGPEGSGPGQEGQDGAGERSSGCAAAYTGPGCTQPRHLPCFGLAFPDRNSLTLNQKSAAATRPAAANGHPAHHPHIPPALAAKLPPLPFMGEDSRPFKRCALVGNSPMIMEHEWGEEIDQHGLVARCNNAPTAHFTKRVGRWTSFRYQNERYSGFRETSEPTIGRYCTTVYVKGMVPCAAGKEFVDSLKTEELQNMLTKKMHPLNPMFDHWIEEPFHRNNTMPSTGFRALAVLLHMCEHVTMYGFGGTGDNYRVWYWNKYKGYKGKPPPKVLMTKFPKLIKKAWKVSKWDYAGENKHTTKKSLTNPNAPYQPGRRLLEVTSGAPEHSRAIEDACLAELSLAGLVTVKK